MKSVEANTYPRNGDDWQANVCKRLAAEPNFPNDEIIKLYLCSHHDLDAENGVPALMSMPWWISWATRTTGRHLTSGDQPYIYLRRLAASSPPCQKLLLCDRYGFHSIQRIKVRHGRPCYLVRWMTKRAGDDDDGSMFVVTEEDIRLVSAAFPDQARRFQEQEVYIWLHA